MVSLHAVNPPPIPPPPDPLRRYRLGVLGGALALALYVTLLARNDIDAALGQGQWPALPGGWKALALILALGLAAVIAAGAWQAGWRGAALRRWAGAHPAALALGGIMLGALVLRV